MKTNTFKILIALGALAALAAPLQAAPPHSRDSRQPYSGRRPETRHYQPQGGSYGRQDFRPYPRPTVYTSWGYYPPPPQVVYYGYPPPPPPPAQVIYWGYPPPRPVCYPYPRPGFNIMLNF